MSDADADVDAEAPTAADEEPGVLTKVYRTVSPRYTSHGDFEMDVVGWSLFLGVFLLMLPLLPLFVVVWVVVKVLDAVAPSGD